MTSDQEQLDMIGKIWGLSLQIVKIGLRWLGLDGLGFCCVSAANPFWIKIAQWTDRCCIASDSFAFTPSWLKLTYFISLILHIFKMSKCDKMRSVLCSYWSAANMWPLLARICPQSFFSESKLFSINCRRSGEGLISLNFKIKQFLQGYFFWKRFLPFTWTQMI